MKPSSGTQSTSEMYVIRNNKTTCQYTTLLTIQKASFRNKKGKHTAVKSFPFYISET